MKALRILPGLALVASAAACGDAPAPLLPDGPAYNGHTLGSGGGTGTTTGETESEPTDERGHTLGSGG